MCRLLAGLYDRSRWLVSRVRPAFAAYPGADLELLLDGRAYIDDRDFSLLKGL